MSADPEICDVCGYPLGWDAVHDECGTARREDLAVQHREPAVANPDEEPLS